jgi:hypothetical protein
MNNNIEKGKETSAIGSIGSIGAFVAQFPHFVFVDDGHPEAEDYCSNYIQYFDYKKQKQKQSS